MSIINRIACRSVIIAACGAACVAATEAATAAATVPQWQVVEFEFTSEKDYENPLPKSSSSGSCVGYDRKNRSGYLDDSFPPLCIANTFYFTDMQWLPTSAMLVSGKFDQLAGVARKNIALFDLLPVPLGDE